MKARVLVTFLALFGMSQICHAVPTDVTTPGDSMIATSNNSPGGEGVGNSIDNNNGTKYLNFDELNTGFTTWPSKGLSQVTGLTLTTANDAPERDPATYELYGTNDGGQSFALISAGATGLPTTRFSTVSIPVANSSIFAGYRLLFPTVRDAASANSMQIAEVQLLSDLVIGDITSPGNPITATSNNSPGNEGVANAIDNNTGTKYLNFDELNTGFTVNPGGLTVVTGISLTTANDAPERDPASYQVLGSNDGVLFTLIGSGTVPALSTRFFERNFSFPNTQAFSQYRVLFPTVVNAAAANSMQIAEVKLLGQAAVPEPASISMLMLGAVGLLRRRRTA